MFNDISPQSFLNNFLNHVHFYYSHSSTSPTQPTCSNAITTNAINNGMNRTQTIASICPAIPDIITRSCSVGYLDDFELTPGEVTLSQLRNEAPKRLVLVDRKIQSNRKFRRLHNRDIQSVQQLRTKSFKKSISLDSCELKDIPNLHKDLNNLFNHMPKLAESSENQSEDTEHSSTELSTLAIRKNKLTSTPKRSPKEKFCSFFSSRSGTPVFGRKFKKESACSCSNASCPKCSVNNDENKNPLTTKPPLIPRWNKNKQGNENGESSKPPREHKRNKNLEIITSFTDSPLFSRKYRAAKNEFGNVASGGNANGNQLQSEQNTPILGRRNENRSSSSDSGNGTVEVIPSEAKTSVSLHTQVNISHPL